MGLESPEEYFGAADRRNMLNPLLSHQQKCDAWIKNAARKKSVTTLLASMPEISADASKKRAFMEAMHLQTSFGSEDPVIAVAEKLADKHLAKSLKEATRPAKKPFLGGAGGGDSARVRELEAQLAEASARAAALASRPGERGGGKGKGEKGTFVSGAVGCWWCGSFDHKAKDMWGQDICPEKLAGRPKKV